MFLTKVYVHVLIYTNMYKNLKSEIGSQWEREGDLAFILHPSYITWLFFLNVVCIIFIVKI